MAKKAKKGNGKAKVAPKPEQPKEATKAKSGERTRDQGSHHQAPDLDALRKPLLAAKTKLDAADAEAKALVRRAEALVDEAKHACHEALAGFRSQLRLRARQSTLRKPTWAA